MEIAALPVTVIAEWGRVSMHGVSPGLAEVQARALGLPLIEVELPWPCPNDEYERRMTKACQRLRAEGFEAIVFGDIHPVDVRAYRESRLAETGIKPLFPLSGFDSADLVEKMLAAGLRAVIACLDPSRLHPALAGAELTHEAVGGLPAHVDPCGENGEFHTLAFAGPMFRHPAAVRTGACLHRDGFY